MDIHSHLEYLCRVCAANTKGKNSVAECVYILKTSNLKDKLDKFLYLNISDKDLLPKVLCKSCFRQVEATASLSKIAQHTQQVFRDFLLSKLPKGPSENVNASEFTSSDFMGSKDANKKGKQNEPAAPNAHLPPPPLPAAASSSLLLPPPLVKSLTNSSRKDEVVVNVSVADPLTRDNQQKMISNSQRRQSLLLESRFAPKSIAQKSSAQTSAATQKLIAPKGNQSMEIVNTINTNSKNPASLLNFYPVKMPQPALPTQITTFSSGGYVIGRINNDKEESKKSSVPLATAADNIIQQKRKNLVKALNNIKANNSGQVSLLKSSQQKQVEAHQHVNKTPSGEAVGQVPEDELPDKFIIAAPKNKSSAEKPKKEPLNLSSKVPGVPAQLPGTTTIVQQPPDETNNIFPGFGMKSCFPDDILLGGVIRDMDLLKLILKALKWPISKQNMELQLQRLKSSKFTEIMSDSNLLQDRDLTQLLGPYLAPVLLAAHALHQQQQQVMQSTALNENVPATTPPQPKMTALEAAQAEINKSIPYKLPPETSVQLVPATPEETEPTQSPPLTTINTTATITTTLKRDRLKDTRAGGSGKRSRKSNGPRARDSIIISDEDETSNEEVSSNNSKQRSNKSTPNIQIELNSNFMSQLNFLNRSGGNDADELMALLLKQKTSLSKDNKVQKRRRNSISNILSLPPSEFDALIDLDDDIVLMEPVSTTSSSETTPNNVEPQQQKTDPTNTFVIPSVPLITRPIIKRRKTVIHPPKNRFDLSMELKDNNACQQASISLLKTREKRIEDIINQVASGNITNTETTTPPVPATNVSNEAAVVKPVELPATKAPQQKKTQNKSTLGRQLLEAIGLQKIPVKIVNKPQTEPATSSSTAPNAISVSPNSKQSIQQIRTALKKSLKQAQEQQQQHQQRKKELPSSANNTVIQDADSTTKPAVKEVVVLEGKANSDGSSSSTMDVEDQIDKVTLMVLPNEENNNSEESTTKTTASQKKDLKKLTGHQIQDKEKTNKEDLEEKVIESQQTGDNGKFENNGSTTTVSSEITVPKKRGRKRLVDKLRELEAAEANKLLAGEEESEATENSRNEEESEGNRTPGRPTRQSKTQSKYYKGPDKVIQGRRCLPSRTTRNRKYC